MNYYNTYFSAAVRAAAVQNYAYKENWKSTQ
jgi:hypothetical protein